MPNQTNRRRDRTKRSTSPGSGVHLYHVLSGHRAAYERCTVIRTIRSGNSCNFAAMPGYFCARDVDVRTRAYVLYVLCAWVHQGTGNSGMPGCVEHLSSGTAAPDGIGSMRFIAPERLQPEVRGR